MNQEIINKYETVIIKDTSEIIDLLLPESDYVKGDDKFMVLDNYKIKKT